MCSSACINQQEMSDKYRYHDPVYSWSYCEKMSVNPGSLHPSFPSVQYDTEYSWGNWDDNLVRVLIENNTYDNVAHLLDTARPGYRCIFTLKLFAKSIEHHADGVLRALLDRPNLFVLREMPMRIMWLTARIRIDVGYHWESAARIERAMKLLYNSQVIEISVTDFPQFSCCLCVGDLCQTTLWFETQMLTNWFHHLAIWFYDTSAEMLRKIEIIMFYIVSSLHRHGREGSPAGLPACRCFVRQDRLTTSQANCMWSLACETSSTRLLDLILTHYTNAKLMSRIRTNRVITNLTWTEMTFVFLNHPCVPVARQREELFAMFRQATDDIHTSLRPHLRKLLRRMIDADTLAWDDVVFLFRKSVKRGYVRCMLALYALRDLHMELIECVKCRPVCAAARLLVNRTLVSYALGVRQLPLSVYVLHWIYEFYDPYADRLPATERLRLLGNVCASRNALGNRRTRAPISADPHAKRRAVGNAVDNFIAPKGSNMCQRCGFYRRLRLNTFDTTHTLLLCDECASKK
jgi:hypothetical protein